MKNILVDREIESSSKYLVRTQIAIDLIHETLAKTHYLPAYKIIFQTT